MCMLVALGHPLDVSTEELIGKEQHLAVLRHARHDLNRIGRRAAEVGLCLHLGTRVDVGDDDGTGVL